MWFQTEAQFMDIVVDVLTHPNDFSFITHYLGLQLFFFFNICLYLYIWHFEWKQSP